eukprot:gene7393-5206_t
MTTGETVMPSPFCVFLHSPVQSHFSHTRLVPFDTRIIRRNPTLTNVRWNHIVFSYIMISHSFLLLFAIIINTVMRISFIDCFNFSFSAHLPTYPIPTYRGTALRNSREEDKRVREKEIQLRSRDRSAYLPHLFSSSLIHPIELPLSFSLSRLERAYSSSLQDLSLLLNFLFHILNEYFSFILAPPPLHIADSLPSIAAFYLFIDIICVVLEQQEGIGRGETQAKGKATRTERHAEIHNTEEEMKIRVRASETAGATSPHWGRGEAILHSLLKMQKKGRGSSFIPSIYEHITPSKNKMKQIKAINANLHGCEGGGGIFNLSRRDPNPLQQCPASRTSPAIVSSAPFLLRYLFSSLPPVSSYSKRLLDFFPFFFSLLFLGHVPPLPSMIPRYCHLLTFLIALLLHSPVRAADPLYILDLFTWTPISGFPTEPQHEGLKAALAATGMGANGRTIELIEPDLSSGSIAEAIEKAMTAHPSIMAIAGPVSDELLAETLAYTKEHYPTLTAVGPFTNYLESRVWSPQAYFLRADSTAESFAIVTYLVDKLRVKRIGVMHLTGSQISPSGFNILCTALYTIHQLVPITYMQPVDSAFSTTAFDAFAAQDPQVIIIHASEEDHLYGFLMACASSPVISGRPIFFTSGSYLGMYKAMLNAKGQLNFFFSVTNLLPSDTQFEHIKVFEQEMKAYIASGESAFTDYDDIQNPIVGGLAVSGWVTGKILHQTMWLPQALKDRETYQLALFNQRQYVVEYDNVIGAFAGVCSAYERLQNVPCMCNQGGHTVNVYSLATLPTISASLQSTFGYPFHICYPVDYRLPFYAQSVVPKVPGCAVLDASASDIETGLRGAVEPYWGDEVRLHVTTTLIMDGVSSLVEYTNDYLLDVVIGPVVDLREAAAALPSTLIVNPLTAWPTPRVVSKNVLYLTPTLDQQIFIWAQVAKEHQMDMAVLLRSRDERENIISIIRDAAQVFSLTIRIVDIENAEDIRRSVKHRLVLVVGLSEAAIPSIRNTLRRRSSRYVALLYDEFSLYYTSLVTTFASEPIEVQRRLLTLTNLPMWNDYSEETAVRYPALAEYHKSISDPSLVNPLSFQTFYSTGVLNQILTCQYGNVSTDLPSCIYRFSYYEFGGVTFGKLDWEKWCKDIYDPNCKNSGASSMDAISMARALNASEPVTWGSLEARIEAPSPKSMNMNLMLAVGIPLCVIVFFVACLFLYLCYWRHARQNRKAPKDNCKPVTLMFTDIQSSTALWASFPEQMTEAMEAHHALIRREILQFDCYEVKTIGDSFMIASRDAAKMLQLAVAIQKALFQFDWGTNCFDQHYYRCCLPEEQRPLNESNMRELGRGESEIFSGLVSTSTGMLLPANYKDSWNGLRVRIGIHTGMCDIRFDEVTKGFDYYGDTVNIAARTESTAMGGQILLTKSVWDSACESGDLVLLETLSIQDVGAHTLRGVAHPVQMYQLDAIPHRNFKDVTSAEDEESNELEEDDLVQLVDPIEPHFKSAAAETTYKVICGVLSPFGPKKKVEKIKSLMTQWRLSTAYSTAGASDERVFLSLLLRFVNRTAKVIAHRQHMIETEQLHAANYSEQMSTSAPMLQVHSSQPTSALRRPPSGSFSRFTSRKTPNHSFQWSLTERPQRRVMIAVEDPLYQWKGTGAAGEMVPPPPPSASCKNPASAHELPLRSPQPPENTAMHRATMAAPLPPIALAKMTEDEEERGSFPPVAQEHNPVPTTSSTPSQKSVTGSPLNPLSCTNVHVLVQDGGEEKSPPLTVEATTFDFVDRITSKGKAGNRLQKKTTKKQQKKNMCVLMFDPLLFFIIIIEKIETTKATSFLLLLLPLRPHPNINDSPLRTDIIYTESGEAENRYIRCIWCSSHVHCRNICDNSSGHFLRLSGVQVEADMNHNDEIEKCGSCMFPNPVKGVDSSCGIPFFFSFCCCIPPYEQFNINNLYILTISMAEINNFLPLSPALDSIMLYVLRASLFPFVFAFPLFIIIIIIIITIIFFYFSSSSFVHVSAFYLCSLSSCYFRLNYLHIHFVKRYQHSLFFLSRLGKVRESFSDCPIERVRSGPPAVTTNSSPLLNFSFFFLLIVVKEEDEFDVCSAGTILFSSLTNRRPLNKRGFKKTNNRNTNRYRLPPIKSRFSFWWWLAVLFVVVVSPSSTTANDIFSTEKPIYVLNAFTPIQLMDLDISTGASIGDAIAATVSGEKAAVAMVGPMSDSLLAQTLDYTQEQLPALTAVGPYTNDLESRFWSKQAYFLRADPTAEIYAIVSHVVSTLNVRRVGVMHLAGSLISDKGFDQLRTALFTMHQLIPVLYPWILELSPSTRTNVAQPERPCKWGPSDLTVVAPPSASLNVNLILAGGIPFAVAADVLLGMFVFLFCWGKSRNNTNAPKDESKPVTIMFTDVQSSTALWAEFPEEMAEAMEIHHETIRNEIRKFECYEVKTIGDSFMIACRDPTKAVELAVAIQVALFRVPWTSLCFDHFYYQNVEMGARNRIEESKRPLEQRRESVVLNVSMIGLSIPDNYKDSWNGLRVRIGIHTGMCEIRFDEVTKGFDYYGDTVNIAARTESTAMGGQILITKSTWDCVCAVADHSLLESLAVKSVGALDLAGVPYPVQIYQVDAVPHREFFDPQSSDDDEGEEVEDPTSDSSTELRVDRFRSPMSEVTYNLLSSILSPFHEKKKVERITEIMAWWKVPTNVWVLDPTPQRLFHALLLRFVNHRGRVIERREAMQEIEFHFNSCALLSGPSASMRDSAIFSNAQLSGAANAQHSGRVSRRCSIGALGLVSPCQSPRRGSPLAAATPRSATTQDRCSRLRRHQTPSTDPEMHHTVSPTQMNLSENNISLSGGGRLGPSDLRATQKPNACSISSPTTEVAAPLTHDGVDTAAPQSLRNGRSGTRGEKKAVSSESGVQPSQASTADSPTTTRPVTVTKVVAEESGGGPLHIITTPIGASVRDKEEEEEDGRATGSPFSLAGTLAMSNVRPLTEPQTIPRDGDGSGSVGAGSTEGHPNPLSLTHSAANTGLLHTRPTSSALPPRCEGTSGGPEDITDREGVGVTSVVGYRIWTMFRGRHINVCTCMCTYSYPMMEKRMIRTAWTLLCLPNFMLGDENNRAYIELGMLYLFAMILPATLLVKDGAVDTNTAVMPCSTDDPVRSGLGLASRKKKDPSRCLPSWGKKEATVSKCFFFVLLLVLFPATDESTIHTSGPAPSPSPFLERTCRSCNNMNHGLQCKKHAFDGNRNSFSPICLVIIISLSFLSILNPSLLSHPPSPPLNVEGLSFFLLLFSTCGAYPMYNHNHSARIRSQANQEEEGQQWHTETRNAATTYISLFIHLLLLFYLKKIHHNLATRWSETTVNPIIDTISLQKEKNSFKNKQTNKQKTRVRAYSFAMLRPHRSGCVVRRRSSSTTALLGLLGLTLLSIAIGLAVGDTEPLYVLNLYSFSNDGAAGSRLAQGLKIALAAARTGANGRPIELVEPDISLTIAEAIEKAMTAHPSIMAIAGPVSDELLAETLAYTKEHYPTLTAVGPFTMYQESRVWSPQAYFLRADPTAEIYALVSQVVVRMRLKRIGVMHLTGTDLSEKGYEQLRTALYTIHQLIPIEYVEPADSPLKLASFRAFADQHPQAVIMYSVSRDHALEFVAACRTDEVLQNTPICFTGAGYRIISSSIINHDKMPTLMYFSSTNLLPTDDSFSIMQVFGKEWKAYNNNYEEVSFSNPMLGSLAVSGWITGKILAQALSLSSSVVSREVFQRDLFNHRQYTVEYSDIIGVFAGDCDMYEILQMSICNCNQGGHSVGVYHLGETELKDGSDRLQARMESAFAFPREYCYTSDYELPSFSQWLLMNYRSASETVQLAQLSIQQGLNAASDVYYQRLVFFNQETILFEGIDSLLNFSSNYLLDVIIGTVENPSEIAAALPQVLVVNPTALSPIPRIARPNVLYITPTLEQQIYLWTSLAQRYGHTLAVALAQNDAYDAITSIIHDAAQVYSTSVNILTLGNTKSIHRFPIKDYVLVIGIDEASLVPTRDWLRRHPKCHVCLIYEQFTLFYHDLVDIFASEPIEVQRRLLTLTNLPMWNDYSEETAASFPDLAKYHETVDKEFVNPLSLEAWYSAGILRKVLSCQSGNTTSTLLECTYHLSTYSFGGLAFGNLAWDSSCPSAFSPLCRNFGAKNMNIISMAKALNNSAEVAAGPFTVDVVPPTPVSFNVTEFAAITAPLFAVVAICLSLVLYFCCWKSARDNHFAPKNAAQPVTIMFTDIQSSTALWAEFPEEMVEAMESHHEIIRNEIRKFECYEVKTIGDSFMIACTDALKAVQLSVSIQKALFQYDWGTSAFDAFYSSGDHPGDPIVGAQNTGPHGDAEMGNDTSFNAGLQGDPEEGEIQNSFISGLPANYKEKWHGLRVRIGIHTGMCDIRFDEVTKGFDYYGDTVNIAARTEATAMGGQILITKNTWDDACKSSDSRCVARLTVTDYGAHTLRGVSHAVDMYEVEGVPNRVFSVAVKGKEDEASSDDDGDPETRSLDSFTEMVGPNVKNTFAETTFKIVSGVLSTFHHKRKVELLKEIMRQWRVPTEVRKSDPNDEKAFTVLLSRFVNSRAKVMARREYLRETPMQGSLTAHSSTTSPTAVAPAQRRCSITFSGMGVGVGSPSPHCSAQRSRDASCCRLPRGEVPPWSAAAQRRESGRWRVGSSGPQRRIPSASPSRQRLGALATEIAVPPIQSISERPHTSSDALCVSPQTLLEALPVPMPPKWCDARLSSGSDTRNPLIQHSTAAIMASDTERTQAGSTDKPGTASPEAATGSQPVSEGVGAGQPGRLPKQLEEEETKITTTKKKNINPEGNNTIYHMLKNSVGRLQTFSILHSVQT